MQIKIKIISFYMIYPFVTFYRFAEVVGHLFNKTSGAWVQNKPDLLKVIGYYKEKYNITRIGIYGYCWGGFVSVSAASDPDFKDLNAIGLVHPSRVNTDDAKNINIPAILLPSQAEPDMVIVLNCIL
jgi:dienelactone hydrolase